jgi:hypothetical protein
LKGKRNAFRQNATKNQKHKGIIKCYNRKIGLMLTPVQKKKAIMIYEHQRGKKLMINKKHTQKMVNKNKIKSS